MDVGEVNGRVFVNNSGVGFYPHFVRQREEQEKHGHIKRVAFMLALRAVVRRYFRLRMKVHMDEAEALEHVTPFLFVGNNRYQTSGAHDRYAIQAEFGPIVGMHGADLRPPKRYIRRYEDARGASY